MTGVTTDNKDFKDEDKARSNNMSSSLDTEDHAHYGNAPIVEAILEARIATPMPISLDLLSKVVNDSARFPKRVELMTASGQMIVGPTVSASATSQRMGYQFFSSDHKYVVHSKLDGLAVSRLAPYTDWEDVFGEFRNHWQRYLELVEPDVLIQLAVRYVNRFDLPGERVELHDYFRTYPEVSKDIPYDVSGFLNQLQFPMPDINGHATLTQARVPPPRDDVISILVDIAILRNVNEPAKNFDIDRTMNILRNKKNALFEACMKKQARDLIREVPT
jgi:uncharacterized protein (TIGR04255 family)